MKKESKKEIYARYGISYDNKTGKISSPIGTHRPLLIDGNKKIGKGVYHFSMLPANIYFEVKVCGKPMVVHGTCPCRCTGCYALTGNYRFKSTKNSLAIRTVLAREYLDYTEKAIQAQIEADNISIVRIHAAGDIKCALREYMKNHPENEQNKK